MSLIFGLDIGTTSIGFAVIEHDSERHTGEIKRLGVRIFPEARDPKGVPLNQERRQARLRRRQLRRRRERRRELSDLLSEAGLLPPRNSAEWDETMKADPYDLRKRAFEGETLPPHEIGRAIYHLAQRRHFKGRDIDEVSDDAAPDKEEDDDKEATNSRDKTIKSLNDEGKTLGAWLAERGPHDRKRGEHAIRHVVEKEFDEVLSRGVPDEFRSRIRDAIFFQRPTFWRLNTLGECRLIPGSPPCPKGSWLSQQRRMLEKLNNLALAGGNQRPLDQEERGAILAKLQTCQSMTWAGVKKALGPLYKKRGEEGQEEALKFNLQEGGESKLLGNAIEAKLASIFGGDWDEHPNKQEIREVIPDQIWQADYEKIGKVGEEQRVVILPAGERTVRREEVVRKCVEDYGLSSDQAEEIRKLKLPTGWEPYSTEALQKTLPHLEAGVRFGELINGPEWEEWRDETFPQREQPTGEILDKLPSPMNREESKRIANLRNPTVARTRNEMRKVVNNLIDMFGKPDLIRVELARNVGHSKRQREDMQKGMRRAAKRRDAAREELAENGIQRPSREDVEKWVLWEESGHRCPYTGDSIGFDQLFRTGEYEIEHIWPRSRSLDDSMRNKTLCRRDVNAAKGNQTPYEYFRSKPDEWDALVNRVQDMKASRGGIGMSPGKVKRFISQNPIPDDFAARQLVDTSYAAREIVAFLKKLWPDLGPTAPDNVQTVSGRVTAHLRRLWGLNKILADDGEKTRDDHRHHAVDALAVACCHRGMTQVLSRFWQAKDDSRAAEPDIRPPWKSIRTDAEDALEKVIVSHRVRKKVSGALHKETIYGDTGREESNRGTVYRYFSYRKKVEDISKSDLAEKSKELWPDQRVRDILVAWVNEHGDGDPKKAFPPYPKHGRKGRRIRSVRLLKKQQVDLMAKVSTGYADLGNNHHMAIYKRVDGTVDYDIVSMHEASIRNSMKEPVVRRDREDGSQFLMSLSAGDALQFMEDGEMVFRVVSSVWSDGHIVLTDHTDAVGATIVRPGPKTVVSNGGKKISVDPIGRIRPAND